MLRGVRVLSELIKNIREENGASSKRKQQTTLRDVGRKRVMESKGRKLFRNKSDKY